ncbi:hypothetical protein EV44_g5616 [Erysiphe necator]|uniref:Uncharacterized protein n=1 Tax=Uncinula necator TaxID=52586 RepID=A0A0B1NZF0_UNCNE|nr:hypothetical protein EV44_g5616 [Erysiphe necator]
MAPIRRYVRITKYSVLECRIFLDNPNLGESWLSNPRTEILPRVMKSVFPLITPKLREEYERSKNKSTKKSRIKDIVVEGDSTEDDIACDVDIPSINIENEECNGSNLCLHELPEASKNDWTSSLDQSAVDLGQQEKRKRTRDARSLGSSSSDVESSCKKPKNQDSSGSEEELEDKKMEIRTTYEGFTIYGRVLCLIVKRRDGSGKASSEPIGQATMENWISSTQLPLENEELAK